MSDYILQTTISTARKLQALLDSVDDYATVSPHQTAPRGISGNVIVETDAAVDPSDFEPVAMRLVVLQAGSWVDTGQRLNVRVLGEDGAEADTRYIARQVSSLGYCILGPCQSVSASPAAIPTGGFEPTPGPAVPEP